MSVCSLTEASDPDAVPIWAVTEAELTVWRAQTCFVSHPESL